jgi:hypothetical protein
MIGYEAAMHRPMQDEFMRTMAWGLLTAELEGKSLKKTTLFLSMFPNGAYDDFFPT